MDETASGTSNSSPIKASISKRYGKPSPCNEGDDYAGEETKKKAWQAVTGTLDRDPTDVPGICCNESGERALFIGLPS